MLENIDPIGPEDVAKTQPPVEGVSYNSEGIPVLVRKIELARTSNEEYVKRREEIKDAISKIRVLGEGEIKPFLFAISEGVRTLITDAGDIDNSVETTFGIKNINPKAILDGKNDNFMATAIPAYGLVSIKCSDGGFNENGRPLNGIEIYLPIEPKYSNYTKYSLTLSQLDSNGNFLKGVHIDKMSPSDAEFFKECLSKSLNRLIEETPEKIE